MSKLIDIEKVKTVIERRIGVFYSILEACSSEDWHYDITESRIFELKAILSLLDTLQEEPVSKDLKEAAEKYSFAERGIDAHGEAYTDYNIYKFEGFKAGAQWQKQQYVEDIKTAEDHAFLAGADWQKQQQENCLKIKGWLARDKYGQLFFYHEKPERHLSDVWLSLEDAFPIDDSIDNSLFPEITWDSEPRECELTIRKA